MTSTISDWGVITVSSLQELWTGFINFLPALIGALVVLIIGWIVAIALGRLASQLLKAIKVDHISEKIGIQKGLEKTGCKADISHWFGELVKWFLIIVFIMASADILGLVQVSDFLTQVLFYLPNIIVAVIILLAAALISSFLSNIIRGSVKAIGFASADFLAAVTRWSIMIFAMLAALDQLGVASAIINTLVTGFVAMLAIAGGLAFGLGGRDVAGDILKKIRNEISKN